MKNVLITGGGTGLGRALALKYSQNDYHVILTGRTDLNLLMVQKEIQENGGSAEVIVCDVREPASVEEVFKQLDHLNVLINNAGLGIFGPLDEYKEKDIDCLFDTNVKGTILMTQRAASLLKQANGRVLNIISTAGLRGKNNETIYCASKFAVRGFTESLHKEWENEPITATAVYMGGMNTPFWDESEHVKDPSQLKGPEVVADQIFKEDDGRAEIIVDR
ncbi:SDR family oxidoreductase [Halobacillus sp. Marseille-Q1614]|uniref:SDR family NAD(P)-dependent oxidoreductase n=1 Tax=Halobacillus sp. Marseille-Q1614 TaxID=2709134 RepID=UPI00156DB4D0|nr:SDR family oxidoreductase [Halobacillus sp. Marseille-Q1614]